jgi:L-fuconolactonase
MQLIDTHVHVWTHAPEFPLASQTSSLPPYDARPEDLLDTMAQNNVECAVLVHHIAYGWDNSYVAQVRKRFPARFMAVCRVNPEDPLAPDHLSQLTEIHGFHGVRISPDPLKHEDWFTDDSLMLPLFRRANELKVPVLILTKPSRLAHLGRILDQVPETCVVIDHMADSARGNTDDHEQLLLLAPYPRVYLKMSHVSINASNNFLKQVCATFGVERIMWGSDWPLCLNARTYPQVITNVRDEMDFLTTADLEWVYRKTALQIWSFADTR